MEVSLLEAQIQPVVGLPVYCRTENGMSSHLQGLLGVLLQRNPSKIELVSDINGDLINWWTIIRDRPEELRDLLNKSPLWSRALWHQSAEMVNKEKDPLKRAYWWTIMLNWSYGSTGKWIKDFYRHGAKKPTRIEEKI